MSPNPKQLSEELRNGNSVALDRRRDIALLTLTAISSMAVISLYQLGILKRLPEPPSRLFNTKKVNASQEGYSKLDMPDAVLGLGSYAATLGLAAMGGKERAKTHPWIPLALAGKVFVDAAQAARLTRDAWVKHGALSIYSLVAAAATFATLPLALPEARAAWRRWSG